MRTRRSRRKLIPEFIWLVIFFGDSGKARGPQNVVDVLLEIELVEEFTMRERVDSEKAIEATGGEKGAVGMNGDGAHGASIAAKLAVDHAASVAEIDAVDVAAGVAGVGGGGVVVGGDGGVRGARGGRHLQHGAAVAEAGIVQSHLLLVGGHHGQVDLAFVPVKVFVVDGHSHVQIVVGQVFGHPHLLLAFRVPDGHLLIAPCRADSSQQLVRRVSGAQHFTGKLGVSPSLHWHFDDHFFVVINLA